MKKLILFLGLILGVYCNVHADSNCFDPMVSNYDLSCSSRTNGITPAALVVFSSYPFILKGINVYSPGTASKLEIFNSATSTTDFKDMKTIDTTAKISYNFQNLYFSSGIAIYNQGTSPADVEIIGRLK